MKKSHVRNFYGKPPRSDGRLREGQKDTSRNTEMGTVLWRKMLDQKDDIIKKDVFKFASVGENA